VFGNQAQSSIQNACLRVLRVMKRNRLPAWVEAMMRA